LALGGKVEEVKDLNKHSRLYFSNLEIEERKKKTQRT